MGVATSLPYDMEEEITFSPSLHWQLYHGKKKEDDPTKVKEQVSIFKFLRSQSLSTNLPQKGIQRIRTIKHPYVLSFVASSEMEDSYAVVTEYAIPFSVWIKQHLSSTHTQSEKESLTMEILWGLKCILDACNFLHTTCRISHSFISPQSCFVTKNGDWKLGFFDLACDISVESEHFKQFESLLETNYRSPERIDGTWNEKYSKNDSEQSSSSSSSSPQPILGSAMDIYSLGKLIQYIFETLPHIEIPQCLNSPLKRMISPDHKRRPTCSSLLRLQCFQSDQLSLMTSISELQLKPPSECLEVFKTLKEKADVISRAACTFKILPSVGQSLNQAVNDFQNRDLRELSRQTVQASLDLLACFSIQHKVEEIPFQTCCLIPIQNLWTISDRSIRTSLLKTLKPIIQYFSKDAVNRKIFEPLIGGFSDSNAKLREETLKSLVHVVDKLEETQLQDKLVRCITNLQQDPENSIRTNATIFLSRIMPKLKDSVRAKVLVSAYTKAMKDSFSHCRIAGLKAADACLAPVCLCEIDQLCGKLMPQICLLLVDKSNDVRELALNVLGTCTEVVRNYMKEQKKTSTNIEDNSHSISNNSIATSTALSSTNLSSLSTTTGITAGTSSSTTINSNQTNNNTNSGWTSWAVDGFSKSIEKVALNATESQVNTKPITQSIPQPNQIKEKRSTKPSKDEWGDDDLDFDDDDNDNNNIVNNNTSKSIKSNNNHNNNTSSNQIDDEWNDNFDVKPKTIIPKKSKTDSNDKNVSKKSTSTNNSTKLSNNSKDKNIQPTIKKLAADTSDFDDWDKPLSSSSSKTTTPTISPSVSTSQIQQSTSISNNNSKVNLTDFNDNFDDWGDELDGIDLPPGEAWGDEDDLDLDLNVLGTNDSIKNSSKSTNLKLNSSTSNTKSISSSLSSLSSSSSITQPAVSSIIASTTTAASSSITSSSKTKVVPSAKKEKDPTPVKKSTKSVPVVKKLAVSSTETDNWDEF